MPEKFLLVGHGGFGNRGCEAIIRTTVDIIYRNFPDADVTVASHRPDYDIEILKKEKSPLKIITGTVPMSFPERAVRKAFNVLNQYETWYSLFGEKVYKCLEVAVKDADIVFSVGGDNYTTDYSSNSLRYFLKLNEFIKKHKKPVIIWGASIGPFSTPEIEAEAMANFRKVDMLTVRETETYNHLMEHKIDNVKLVSDPAFLLPAEKPAQEIKFPENEEGVVGLNISPLMKRYLSDEGEKVLRKGIREFCKYILDNTKMGIILIYHVSWQDNDDLAFMEELLSDMLDNPRVEKAPRDLRAVEIKWIISQCRFMVAARTHAQIASLSKQVPILSIGYSRKAVGINKDLFGTEKYLLDIKKLNKETLINSFKTLMADEEKIKETFKEKMPGYIKNADVNLKEALKKILP